MQEITDVVGLTGILALQGNFALHAEMLQRIDAPHIMLRYAHELEKINSLIIPGGETTTMSHLMQKGRLLKPLQAAIQRGMPVFGTCAGCIQLAKQVENCSATRLECMNISVRRNAYGRQTASFEADIAIPAWNIDAFRVYFIRAPIITGLGPQVEVLAQLDGQPILVREGNILAATFHCELETDSRIHQVFLNTINPSPTTITHSGIIHKTNGDSAANNELSPAGVYNQALPV